MALCNISRELLNTQTPDKYQHVAFYSQGPVDSTIIECLYTTASAQSGNHNNNWLQIEGVLGYRTDAKISKYSEGTDNSIWK